MITAPAKPIALTVGEPAGIGPDITVRAWNARHSRAVPPFLYVGDPDLLERRAAALQVDVKVTEAEPRDAVSVFDEAIPCAPGETAVAGTPGRPSVADASAVVASIERAVELVRNRSVAAVVTNPVHKKTLSEARFPHPGHTEFLGKLASRMTGRPMRPVMMLAAPGLRTVPVTIHVPLTEVPAMLSTELIVETALTVASDLRTRFGVAAPRLAVSGLNPHAGEGGLLGTEDETVILPAVEALRQAGIACVGPLPADAMFSPTARASYDAAICMYHDQALIPVKALAFDEAVNVTLGLPFVRTSPDHGTALDIAGTGGARPDSLIAALQLASALSRRDTGD